MHDLISHYLLIGAWVFFLIAARAMRSSQGPKGLIRIAIVGGILATLYEATMTFFMNGPWQCADALGDLLRWEILLVVPVLCLLYAVGLVGICRCAMSGPSRRVVGCVAAIRILLIIGYKGLAWHNVGQHTKQLDRQFHLGRRLVFEAKFRSKEAYQQYFGPVADDISMGHYKAQSNPYYARLVLNENNKMWLFFGDQGSEMFYGPGRLVQDVAVLPFQGGGGKRVTVVTKSPQEIILDIEQIPETKQEEAYAAKQAQRGVVFGAAPPPISSVTPSNALRYLGNYEVLKQEGRGGRYTQFWVWQNHDSLYALRADGDWGWRPKDVSPRVLGRGEFNAEIGAYVFSSVTPNLVVRKVGETLIVSDTASPNEALTLTPTNFIQDDLITLAPLENGTKWAQWFETVLVGHSVKWGVPAEGD